MDRREAIKRVALLMGGVVSAPTLAGVLGGCRTGGEGYAPQTLVGDRDELVATLSELILPETDTPGARTARVNEFIDEMLTSWYPEEERVRFLAGLDEVDRRAQQAHGGTFLEIPTEAQTALLTELDREAFGRPEPVPPEDEVADETAAAERGTDAVERLREDEVVDRDEAADSGDEAATQPPFFRTFKELTLMGYYTSEVGATQELHVNPMGTYEADVPYEEIGRAWA